MPIRQPRPDWLDKVNFIGYYALNPCNGPAQLYLEFAKPIAWEITVAIAQVDVYDFLQTIFRPKFRKSQRKARRGRRGGGRSKGIPDLTEEVAELIGMEVETRSQRMYVTRAVLFDLWEVVDWAQWTAFIFDSSSNLAYDSILGVIRSDKTKCPNLAQLYRTQALWINPPIPNQWLPANADHIEYIRHYWSPNGFGLACETANCFVAWSFKCTAIAQALDVSFRLWNDTTGQILFDERGPIHLEPGGFIELTLSIEVPKNVNCQWQVKVSNGQVALENIKVFSMPVLI